MPDFNYLEIRKASLHLAELDHHLQAFLQQLADEHKALKKQLSEALEENKKLKEERSK